MKRKIIKWGVSLAVLAVVLTVTPLPFKLLEWWVRINGFQASGFSGSLLRKTHIEHLADENSKRSFEFGNLVLEYKLFPLKIKTISIDRLTLKRTRPVATNFSTRLPELLQALQKPIKGKGKDLEMDRFFVGEAEIQFVPGTQPLTVKNLEVRNVRVGSTGADIGSITSDGGTLSLKDNGSVVVVTARLPQSLFEDLNSDLDFHLTLQKGNPLSFQQVILMNSVVMMKGQPTRMTNRSHIQKLFKRPADAAQAQKLFKSFIL